MGNVQRKKRERKKRLKHLRQAVETNYDLTQNVVSVPQSTKMPPPRSVWQNAEPSEFYTGYEEYGNTLPMDPTYLP